MADDTPSYKISVNSHVNYGYALDILLQSFDELGFPRSNVIVTICGRSNEPPELVETSPDREVVIYVPKNCYDLSHAYGIHRFIDHPRVKADYYIGIHDTCVVTNSFEECMKQYVQKMREGDLDVLYALRTKQLGLAGLSYQFMRDHGHNYNQEIDKPGAWDAEHGGKLSYLSFVPPERVGALDFGFHYDPGRPLYSDIVRHPIVIGSMGIIKFVCNDKIDINPPWQERQRP